MIHELRRYTPAPGKRELLLERFRDHVFSLFSRHGFRLERFWVEERGPNIWYLLAWRSHEQRRAAWKAFLADPDWLALQAAEADGPWTEQVDVTFLVEGSGRDAV